MTNDTGSPPTRMLEALATAQTFTRAQVADLLSRAFACEEPTDLAWRNGYEAGYWARVAEENAAYPPDRMELLPNAAEVARARHRRQARVDERYVRSGDHTGGPVPAW